MYSDCESTVSVSRDVSRYGSWDALDSELVEDLRDAYENLKTFPDNDLYGGGNAYNRQDVALLANYPALAMRSGILDFENDPFAWNVLLMVNEFAFSKYVNLLLLPESGKKQPVNEKSLQKLKNLTTDGTLAINRIVRIGEVLGEADDYDNSNWFLLAALKSAKDSEKWRIHDRLISNYLDMGDWKNSEKYISLSEKLDNVEIGTLVGGLRQTASLAEKSGARDDAERIRKRLQNLGSVP